jgi:O-methyltransferase involved in polyketide biosynthesis
VAEGVLVYFEEARVKELVLNLQAHFPGAELVIDGQRPFMIWANSLQLAVGGMSARLHWGLKHGKDLENWGEGISMLEEWFFFDKPEPRLRAIQWMRYLPGIAKSTGIFHYRLGAYAR